jgi:transposase-like protein
MKKLTPVSVRRKLASMRERCAEIEKEEKALRAGYLLLQSRCPHQNKKRYPDVSGGSDSDFECMDCGKQW